MDNSDATDMMEQWRSDGGLFRHMLRNVEPEHVGAMVEMLHRMQESEKPAWVPQGRWAMKMPEGYLLLGEDPAGFDIEPPPARTRGDGRSDVPKVTKLDERDTEGIVALAKKALDMKRPDLDAALAQHLRAGLCQVRCQGRPRR